MYGVAVTNAVGVLALEESIEMITDFKIIKHEILLPRTNSWPSLDASNSWHPIALPSQDGKGINLTKQDQSVLLTYILESTGSYVETNQ